MKKVARRLLRDLLDAGARKRRWTYEESRQWTRAYNAMKRLAGERA